MNNHNIIDNTIKKYNMLPHYSKVVVGVSGGADSMCLLHYLLSVKNQLDLEIIVAHINHNLRGDESLRDENFVRDYCNKNNIKFELKSVDISSLAKDRKIGTEECGRNVRYDFFNKLAGLEGLIATAHTASDNAETLLFNITRGTGINGLSGIPPTRDNIIRPLIFMSREDVEEYCKENKVVYITDSSNLSDNYSRNKIRHHVIPHLKNINSRLENNISKLSETAKEDNDYLLELARLSLNSTEYKNGYDAKKIHSLALPIKKRSIILMAQKHNIKINSNHINIIIGMLSDKGAVDIDENIQFICDGIVCYFTERNKQNDSSLKNINNNWEFRLNKTKEFNINNQKYLIISSHNDNIRQNFKNSKILFNNSINCDIIADNTLIRGRRAGDFFAKAGRNCTKSLKKLLNELKFTQEQRQNLVLIANGSEVLWIDGIGVSERAKVSNLNNSILILKTGDNII